MDANHWTGAPGDCASDPECQPRTEQEQAEREAEGGHRCAPERGCRCSILADAPNDKCPAHGYPQRRCRLCGRYMPSVEPVPVPPGEPWENPFGEDR